MLYLPEMKKTGDRTWLKDALKSRRADRSRLAAEEENLWLKYASYDDFINNYSSAPPASGYHSVLPADDGNVKSDWSIKKILIDHYENSPSHLGELISSRRRKHELDSCPYCGKPVTPSTIDHFLPKEDWPEFAIYPDNLVPQCIDCVPNKGRKYYCVDDGIAMFIHPFYSPLLSNIGFVISASLNESEVVFDVTYKFSNISDAEMPRVRLHIKTLRVTKRIKEYCEALLRRTIRKAKKSRASVARIIECHLPETQEEYYLSNNWEEAFYTAINQRAIIQHIDAFRKPLVAKAPPVVHIQYESIE